MKCRSVVHQSSLDCHEMVRKSAAPTSWGKTCNYLLLCRACHESIHRHNTHLARQLAIKLMEDPRYFNLQQINKISGQRAIQLPEVIRYVRLLYC